MLKALSLSPASFGPDDRTVTWVNGLAIAAWCALALAHLPAGGHFLFDEAYFFEQAVRCAETLRGSVYGPFISSTEPTAFTPGGALWTLLAPPFLFTHDPRAGTAWIILLSALGSVLLDRALRGFGVAPSVRLATVLLETWSAWHARFSDRIWNVNLFYLLAPLMLWLASRLVRRPRWLEWGLLGFVGALSVQVHVSGLMPFLLCLAAVVLRRPGAVRGGALVVALLAFASPFVPYGVAEARSGFWNTKRLESARAPGGVWHMEGVREGSRAPVVYASHAEWLADGRALLAPGSPRFTRALSVLAALGFALLGLLCAHPLRPIAWLAWLGVPAYFVANGRGFGHHYVTAVMPFATLFAGAGAGHLLAHRSKVVRRAVAGYLVLFGAGTVERLRADYPAERTVARQRADVRSMLDDPSHHRPPEDAELFTAAIVARRLERRELFIERQGEPYWVGIDERGSAGTLPLHMGAVLVPVRSR